MTRYNRFVLVAALGMIAANADAADNSVKVDATHTEFTNDRGYRSTVGVEGSFDFGATTLVVRGDRGLRDYGPVEYRANRGTLSLYQDWGSRVSTRTRVAFADESPVFAHRDLVQDVSLKFDPVVLTVGGRRTTYFNDVDVTSFNVGGTYYFDRGSVGYKYTRYDVDGLGHTDAHQVTARLKDSYGTTRLWLGTGSVLQDLDYVADVVEGRSRSITLGREQRITDNIDLTVTAGYIDREREFGDYSGTKVGLGLSYNF